MADGYQSAADQYSAGAKRIDPARPALEEVRRTLQWLPDEDLQRIDRENSAMVASGAERTLAAAAAVTKGPSAPLCAKLKENASDLTARLSLGIEVRIEANARGIKPFPRNENAEDISAVTSTVVKAHCPEAQPWVKPRRAPDMDI